MSFVGTVINSFLSHVAFVFTTAYTGPGTTTDSHVVIPVLLLGFDQRRNLLTGQILISLANIYSFNTAANQNEYQDMLAPGL